MTEKRTGASESRGGVVVRGIGCGIADDSEHPSGAIGDGDGHAGVPDGSKGTTCETLDFLGREWCKRKRAAVATRTGRNEPLAVGCSRQRKRSAPDRTRSSLIRGSGGRRLVEKEGADDEKKKPRSHQFNRMRKIYTRCGRKA
jgi:hypothetical protein